MSSPEGRWDSNVWIGVYSYKPTQLLQHLPFVRGLTGTNAVSAQDWCFCMLIFQRRHRVVAGVTEFWVLSGKKKKTFSEIVFLKVVFSSIKSVLFKRDITFSKKYISFFFLIWCGKFLFRKLNITPNMKATPIIKLCLTSIQNFSGNYYETFWNSSLFCSKKMMTVCYWFSQP